MTVLVDYSQVCLSALFQHVDSDGNVKNRVDNGFAETEFSGSSAVSTDMVRHLLLNSVLYFRRKFLREYGDFIFCVDSPNSWRKQIFPHYKTNRRKSRDKSKLDWGLVHEIMGSLKEELSSHMGYSVISVDQAEADDIIAVLTKHLNQLSERVLILSSDKDFMQLQKYSGVIQYSIHKSDYVETNNAFSFLREHIIRGDSNDSVPNILSPIMSFRDGTRQKSVYAKKVEEWLKTDDVDDIADWDHTIKKRYHQNRVLIDFDSIPEELETNILTTYLSMIHDKIGKVGDIKESSRMTNYFKDNNLHSLFQHIGEF